MSSIKVTSIKNASGTGPSINLNANSIVFSGESTFANTITLAGSMGVAGSMDVSGEMNVSGAMAVSGGLNVSGSMVVSGNVAFAGPPSFNSPVIIGNTLTVNNTSTFNANVGIGTSPVSRLDVNGASVQNIVGIANTNTPVINCSAGNYFMANVNTATTFTFANVANSRAYSFTLEVFHTANTITWPNTVRWPANTAPSLTANNVHLFIFVTDNGGAVWRGSSIVNYVP